MTAFARRPEVLAGAEGVARIIKGDARSEADLRNFAKGLDAIIVILNPPSVTKPTTLQTEAATNLIRAIEAEGPKRIVWTSSTGLDATRPQPLAAIFERIARNFYVDLGRAERVVMGSNADWTIARSVGLTNKPPTGRIRYSFGARVTPSGPYFFSRADLATALVELVTDPRASRLIVSLSRAPGRVHRRAAANAAIANEAGGRGGQTSGPS